MGRHRGYRRDVRRGIAGLAAGAVLAVAFAARKPSSPIDATAGGEVLRSALQGVKVVDLCIVLAGPTCGRTLAEFGADVIKIDSPHTRTVLRHNDINRGKRSVGIDVSRAEGQEVLYELARTADVFLTNYLPQARQKNRFDVEHIRAVNPNIIYARGSALGNKGPEREVGGFESIGRMRNARNRIERGFRSVAFAVVLEEIRQRLNAACVAQGPQRLHRGRLDHAIVVVERGNHGVADTLIDRIVLRLLRE